MALLLASTYMACHLVGATLSPMQFRLVTTPLFLAVVLVAWLIQRLLKPWLSEPKAAVPETAKGLVVQQIYGHCLGP